MIDWFLPAFRAGGPIRSILNMINLLEKDYNFYIITSNKDFGSHKALDGIKEDTWISFSDFTEVIYLSRKNQNLRFIKKLINDNSPDYIYLNSMFSKTFALMPLILNRLGTLNNTNIVLAPRGMLQKGALQYKTLKKSIFFNGLKLVNIFKNISFHATDNQEFIDIKKVLKIDAKKIHICSNIPLNPIDQLIPKLKVVDKLEMVYISRIAPKKNLLFLLNELKNIPVSTNLKFDIFGPIEDVIYWKKCKDIIDNELKNLSISYKGEIEFPNILTIISEYHFFILSTFGENFGHSIFESFAAGRPVIISNNTPWKNLEQDNIGWDLSITEPGHFYKTIIKASQLNQRSFDKMCNDSIKFAHQFIEEADFINKYRNIFK